MASRIPPAVVISVVLFFFAVLVVEVDSSSNLPRKLQFGDRVQADGASVHYEKDIVVETVFDGNRLGMSITRTVAFKNFLFALDSTYSEILKIRLPIDQSKGAEVAQRVAGDGRGGIGYIDGWYEESLLDHPKGLAVDSDGNVYVADVRNRVIRKVTPAGYVSTLAGRANITGHADGEGQNALFSADFDLTYLPGNCSLLISDRGNRRLRTIQLKPPQKCPEKESSDNLWQTVSVLSGILVTILTAALVLVQSQKRELQRSITFQETEDPREPLLSRNSNGYRTSLLTNLPNTRRGSPPGDVSQVNLIDVLDEASQENEFTGSTYLLENYAPNSVGDAEDEVVHIPEEADDGMATTERVRFRLPEHDVLSDSESILSGNDSFSRHLQSSSICLAPDRRIGVDEEIVKNLLLFSQNGSN